MKLQMDPLHKRELIRLIIDAGLEEEFTNWLKQQGYTHFFGKFDNIPGELIETFVKEKRLLADIDEDKEFFNELLRSEELEPPDKRNYIPAKRR